MQIKAINAHTGDIKDILPSLTTCSRDSTVKIKTKSFFLTHGYLNSLAESKEHFFVGCQDGNIVVINKEKNEVENDFRAHDSNVTSLDVFQDESTKLISASWDCTVKIWINQIQRNVFTHPKEVWCVKFIDSENFATACADTILRIFVKNELKFTFNFHFNVIRSISVFDNKIFSVSNEGLFLTCDFNGNLLDHFNFDTMLYSVCVNEKFKVCCGDKGVVFVNGVKKEINVGTLWKCVIVDDKIYLGGSDGKIYVMGENLDLDGDKKELDENKNKLGEDKKGLDDDKINLDKNDELVKNEELDKTQKCTTKVINGKVFQLMDNKWTLIGDVIEKFDNEFPVEVEGKTLKLQFNNDENVFSVADRFLHVNKLNESYRDQIIEYINKNFKLKPKYFSYGEINKDGIKKMLDGKFLFVTDVLFGGESDCVKLENCLKEMFLIDELRFVSLDLYRYFHSTGLNFNCSFLAKFKPKNKKERVVFVKLITNLYDRRPFNLEVFKDLVFGLRDEGMIDEEVFDRYKNNRRISMK